MRKYFAGHGRGNMMAEYGLIGALIALLSVAAIVFLGQKIKNGMGEIANGFSHATGIELVTASSPDVESHASGSVQSGVVPVQGAFMLTLSKGKTIILENYPIDNYNSIEPGRMNRQTEKVATQLTILADTLGSEHVLTATQAGNLRVMAQQMSRIASIEQPIEESRQSKTQNAQVLVNSSFMLDGQSYTLDQLTAMIHSAESGGQSGTEIERLRELLKAALESGTLDDPVVRKMVTRMIERVEQVAGDLEQKSNLQGQTQEQTDLESEKVIGGNG